MTPEQITDRLARRGATPIGEIAELCLARLWYRVCAYRTTHGLPLPPDHLRPALADPTPQRSKGDTP